MWGVSVQHQKSSGTSLDPQCCGLSVINPELSYLLSDIQHPASISGVLSVKTDGANRDFCSPHLVQKYQIIFLPQTSLHKGFAQGNVYSNCLLIFYCFANYNNKNAFHCFLFSFVVAHSICKGFCTGC